MSHTSEALSDGSAESEAGQSEQQVSTAQFETLLEYLTETGWGVEEVGEKPASVVADPPIFTAVLKHDSGSLVQVIPSDSERYSHDTPQFDSHRIRLQNKYTEESVFVTCDTISKSDRFIRLKGFSIEEAVNAGVSELPVWNPPIEITTTEPQATVYAADEEATEKEYVESAISHATLAIVAATHRVDENHQLQTGISDF